VGYDFFARHDSAGIPQTYVELVVAVWSFVIDGGMTAPSAFPTTWLRTLHSGLDKACEFPLMTWFFRIVHAARVFVDLGHLGLVDEDQEDLFAGEILPPHFISRRVVNSPSKISASASATNCASRLGLLPIVRGYCTHRVETAIRADTTGDTKTTSPL